MDPDLEEEAIAHHSNLTDPLPALISAEAGFLGIKIQIQNISRNTRSIPLKSMCNVVPLVSAIMPDGSGKPKKNFLFFAGFGCLRLQWNKFQT